MVGGVRTNRPDSKDKEIEHRTFNIEVGEKQNQHARSAAVFRLPSMFAFESSDFYVQENVIL